MRPDGTNVESASAPVQVLVVEGDRHLRSVVAWVLRDDGRFTVRGDVGSLEEALSIEAPFELALVGLSVTGLGGPRTIADLRQRKPAPMVVVLSSAAGAVYLRHAAMAAGAAGFVVISDDVAELTNRLAQLVGALEG